MNLEQCYPSIIANLKEVIFQINLNGVLTFLNPAWSSVTGFREEEGLGHKLIHFIHADDQAHVQYQFNQLFQGHVQEFRLEIRYLSQDQSIRWMALYACSVRAKGETCNSIAGSFDDITESKSQEQRSSIERAVTDVLAESVSLSEVIPKLLMAISKSLGWDYGEFWTQTSPNTQPQCTESWCCDLTPTSQNSALFDDAAPSTLQISEPVFELGKGFIDQILAGNGLAWLIKLAPDSNSKCPIGSAPTRTILSMPILDGHERIGVMLFFKRAYHPIDKPLLKRLGVIGSQIGEFMMRITAEKQLQKQHSILRSELQEAADYVRSLLPPPMMEEVGIKHHFVPSNQLGGDAFDYYWLDSDHLALYLLDVSGHGVRSTLLSVGVLNLLRNQSLPSVNFFHPKSVLAGLNQTFQMSETGEDYFTIWYGVYDRVHKTITYASAGHPPALLLSPSAAVKPLHAGSLAIGMLPGATYQQESCNLELGSTLYIFSDGVYEITTETGEQWQFGQFVELMRMYHQHQPRNLQRIFTEITRIQGKKTLADDYSLIQADFFS